MKQASKKMCNKKNMFDVKLSFGYRKLNENFITLFLLLNKVFSYKALDS